MAHRRDIELRMEGLMEIREIMNSMKTLAYMENRKLNQRVDNQSLLMQTIERAAADFLSFHPYPHPADRLPTAYLLIGSEHGFCGDFNERIVQTLQSDIELMEPSTPPLIAVGQKLANRLTDNGLTHQSIEGANVTEESGRVIGQIVETVNQLRQSQGGGLRLTAIHHQHNTEKITIKALLPPFQHLAGTSPRHSYSAFANLPPDQLHLGLIDHYLFHVLYEILFTSLLSENLRRVRQLEGAIRHLDERVETLKRKSNQLRQEEIIEEIEVVLLGTANFGASDGNF